jgi:glycosyltransferase involved in cell wall biosynthesis
MNSIKPLNYEIIIVDDGSTDNTGKIAIKHGAKVIFHPYNKGYGAALKTGIREATNENILIIDADGQHNYGDIERIVEHLAEYDMVVGCRTKDSYTQLSRKLGKIFLHQLANYLSGFKIPDLNSGFRTFKKSKVMEFIHILPNTFSFATTITLAFYQRGYSIKHVPIVSEKRKGGKSEVKQVRHGMQTLLLIIRVIMLFNPLKIFVPVSGILFLVGFFYSIYSFIFVKFHIPTGALLLLLSSIIVFLFGVIADQIAALRMEMK